jgi:hypothetical protein
LDDFGDRTLTVAVSPARTEEAEPVRPVPARLAAEPVLAGSESAAAVAPAASTAIPASARHPAEAVAPREEARREED